MVFINGTLTASCLGSLLMAQGKLVCLYSTARILPWNMSLELTGPTLPAIVIRQRKGPKTNFYLPCDCSLSPSYAHLPHIVHLIICFGNTISISLTLNAHTVTTLLCKSYSGCLVPSFLKVQCPFGLWLIHTTIL